MFYFYYLTIAFYAGRVIMTTFGISIQAFVLLGDDRLLLLVLVYLFPILPMWTIRFQKKNPHRNPQAPNIAFVPLAIPSTAGPGQLR